MPYGGAGFGGNNLMLGLNPFQPSENDKNDVYETIGGQKVLREFGSFGKKNAINILMKAP